MVGIENEIHNIEQKRKIMSYLITQLIELKHNYLHEVTQNHSLPYILITRRDYLNTQFRLLLEHGIV